MSTPATSAPTLPGPPLQSSGDQFDASCRWPVLYLLGASLCWLLTACVFGLITSLKFHAPGFLADSAWLTYGRVHAAGRDCLLYGFGIEATLGAGLWMLCRLGRAHFAGPLVAVIGTVCWNFALTWGVVAVLCGDSTGFDGFEMPKAVATLLLAAYLIIALCGLVTFHNRQAGRLYPSQWFVAGALFWFPWIYATAVALLLCVPVRGVLQDVIGWWYAQNLSAVFLSFGGLASVFYFIPRLLGRPLHSHYLAALTFWTLALFAGWGGIPQGAPVPRWITGLSVVGTVFTAVPLIAVLTNIYMTAREDLNALDAHITLRFTYVAVVFWMIAGVQQIVGAMPAVAALTDYTWFTVGQSVLFHYGFFAMALFGAMYFIVPRLLPNEAGTWCPRLAGIHFWCMLAGVVISALALIVGGVGQGVIVSNPQNSALVVVKATLPAVRASTTGDLLILAGTVAFGLNFAGLLARSCRRCWHCYQAEKAGAKTSQEARA